MKKELILELFGKFEEACYNYQGVEYWSERELQHILGYSRWEFFFNVINKAKKACETAGSGAIDHFRDVTKMIAVAKGAQTRYACYLLPKMAIHLNPLSQREIVL